MFLVARVAAEYERRSQAEGTHGHDVSPRQFLATTSAGVLALSLGRLEWAVAASEGAAAGAAGLPSFRGWEDLYRQQWVWDKVVRSTPLGELLVPGALRLERLREGRHGLARGAGRRLPGSPPRRARLQPARLPEGRLLQRAACTTPSRVKLPAQARRRARLRASGSGSPGTQALDEIADSMIDTIVKEGTDRVDLGPRPAHVASARRRPAQMPPLASCSTRPPST